MKKITIDPNLKGKELFKFLIENKEALILQKKEFPKHCDAVSFALSNYLVKSDGTIEKAMPNQIDPAIDSIRVKVVGNAARWCDSHMDVLMPDCWKKTIKDRKGLIKHLRDHVYQLDAEIGDISSIYSQDIALTELGLNISGTTQVLVMESDVKRSYNQRIFEKYRDKKINQHSIGLQYVKIELAINDEESEKEYDFWKKYYDQVINKDVIDDRGYFWVVTEIKLLEISAVLFGSNELTPTLDVKMSTGDQPADSATEKQPQTVKGVDWDKIASKFLN